MAQCKRCGQKVGMLSSYCDACKKQNELDQRVQANERRIKEEADRAAMIAAEVQRADELECARRSAIAGKVEELRMQVTAGQRLFFYDTIYVPVDSLVLGETVSPDFDLDPLRKRGLEGWEVVGVVPRTIGMGLQNRSMDLSAIASYGGGMGGNVLGVHLILRKQIEESTSDKFASDVSPFVALHDLF